MSSDNKIYYERETEELRKKNIRAHRPVRELNDADPEAFETKEALIRELFGTAGEKPGIEHNFHCDIGTNIHVGDHFYAGCNCTI
ncbi:acetyltransferase [Bacillus velezensis]|uniref:maltose acetyltransferase domain-containing protein n=1 Tax=Bacillus velezensis TaxID=492670 RepID=UPI0015F46CD5|nr:maltose acetyltransferase domain-containing protein [Bacillus velezensis]QMT21507.1 acetyltransferase [Bacillus velezensis]